MKLVWTLLLLAAAGLCFIAFPLSAETIRVPSAVTGTALNLTPIDRLPATQSLHLTVSLPWRNPEALTHLLQELYDPHSPNFHHYLSPAEFAERFGPAEKDYQTLIAFARAQGLQVTATHPNRMLLEVSAPVAAVERALHVTLHAYRHPTENRTFYAPDTAPSFDLAVPVLHVAGLDNYSLPRRLSYIETNLPVRPPGAAPLAGSAPGGAYLGGDFRAAYAPGVALTGLGQSVGLVEFKVNYFQSDITAYESQAGLPNVPVVPVLLDGYNGITSQGDSEVSLDIEMAISMAPGISNVVVYEGAETDDILNRMATDDLKQLSASWTYPVDAATDQIFQEFAAQGQSFFNASGDSLAYAGAVPSPCADPNITIVGGTLLTTAGPGGPWVSETVWHRNGNTGGSGGYATNCAIPVWQQGVNMSGNQGSTIGRNLPDVALTAENVWVFYNHGAMYPFGGTSCAAPLWAGFTALINQQAAENGRPPVGFLNPPVYAIGLGANYGACFNDIVTGNNTNDRNPSAFFAVPGYDLCTGWGTPAGQGLIDALAQPAPPGPPLVASQPQNQALQPGGTAAFFTGVTGSFPFAFQWSDNGTNLVGATNSSLILPDVQTNQAGLYTVTVTNALGSAVSSNALLTVTPPEPPVFISQPAGQPVAVGATAVFNPLVTGALPLAYQWTRNATNLSGATNATLTLTNVQLSQAGGYALQAADAGGTTASSNAVLTVYPGWTASGLPTNNWNAVASSADGVRLAAAMNRGWIYTSTNSGLSWTQSGSLSNSWSSVASSADGTRLVAAESKGWIYISANAGATWTRSIAISNKWSAVASSADGTQLAGVIADGQHADPGLIYVSTNAGSTWQNAWVNTQFSPRPNWSGVAASADGTKLVAVAAFSLLNMIDNNGALATIYLSTNTGGVWTEADAPTNNWTAVASSADGTMLAAVAASLTNGLIFLSTNGGADWAQADAPTNNWSAIASSADGSRLVAVAGNGQICFSTNAGFTWWNTAAPAQPWAAVAASADGGKLTAVANQIYTWQTTPTLTLTPAGNPLLFSWPAYWTGAVLQQNLDLNTPGWTAVPGSPGLTNGQVQQWVMPASGNHFYRLAYP